MSKKYLTIILFSIVFNLTLVSAASAWDDTGHKVISYIAWQQMSPEAREKAVKLLLAAPEDSNLSVYYLSGSRSRAAKELDLFMIASTWSDIVRNKDFKARYEKYNKGPWHYADIFWQQTGGKPLIPANRSEGLAIAKLYDFERELKDDSLSDAEKAIDLAWFLHVAGDIHNPLHNASRITEIEPKGDSGGNLFLLSPADARENRVNLHSYWDSILGRNMPRQNDSCDADYIPSIADKVIKDYPFERMKNLLKLENYREWNAEGFGYLDKNVYSADLKRGELPSKFYQARAFAVGERQTALAGYRIGETLNSWFGKSDNNDSSNKLK